MTDPLYFGHFRRLACDPENRIAATPPIITPSRSAAEPRRCVIRTQKSATGFADGARRANHRSACPALFAKRFRFTFHPNHLYIFSCPALTRGAFRDRHERWVRDAVDASDVKRRMTLRADGEAVWSFRPDAGVTLVEAI